MDGSPIDTIQCLDALPVPALLLRAGRVVACNTRARDLLGIDGHAPASTWLVRVESTPAGSPVVVEHDRPGMAPIRIEVSLGPCIDAAGSRFMLLRDVEAEASSRRGLERGLEFERLLTRGSALLMRSTDDRLDEAIEEVLGTVGGFFGVDRAYAFMIDEAAYTQSNTHEWVAPGISSEAGNLQDVPLDAFPWLLARLRGDEVFRYASLDALPAEAANERAEFEREGIQSILIVPLRSAGHLQGFIGFDAVGARVDWDDACVASLRLLAQMLASAIESRATAACLRRQATHDSLTGLPNRLYLRERFGTCSRKSSDAFVAVIDIDDFKRVNDRHGHAGGDALLRELGRRLSAAVSAGGLVARIGGDEFVVVQPCVDERAETVAARLLAVAQAPFELPGGAHRAGISVGLVRSGGDASLDSILDAADAAMYRAKSAGKNRWALAGGREALPIEFAGPASVA